ncbi:ATP-binding cassette domain-containing protein [Candidatus Woesearchaeota archaeon]|jgi:ABC-2 type transport system ATP-binding protein|nr:ATP-binding cassette domain-containing protein [Candidatus Woesearchaeota archaeon]MBT4368401.1 ATP-binding cassette domain-containing protein [Candidatus Woesearchaeota archaeon]MBT4712890.1 ATP-binding cassette domain-containing protein [Candidatus Woesearchaeota archaeon]MBT6639802.1 ATP-binding cassette domain-containing protein [Candidatus Woesearchaeota archaeon]MBT7133974.1 ATP-binding cassette domain-containing protein [Candidatus Woesearchaeota archaeon]
MNSAISVKNLTKTFRTKTREAGVSASFKAIFKPNYKKVHAVNNISFDVKEGELVAFIGPNGAGKSTTLKMLSGILFQDKGECRVNSLDPQTQRKQLAFQIGTVFGQKPQLWFHLPAIESFNLFSKIYELDKEEYTKRMLSLVKKFEIEDLIHQPVRKLSLGQRMRCEFVLSLLHNPKVLFLDEPTIGLDVVVKKTIRELIKKINKEDNVTVILTSHDIADVENICNRVIIVNKGKIVYDGSFERIKKQYLAKKFVKVLSETPINSFEMKGVEIVKKTKFSIELEVNTKETSMGKLIDFLTKNNTINDLSVEETPVEEVIAEIYQR